MKLLLKSSSFSLILEYFIILSLSEWVFLVSLFSRFLQVVVVEKACLLFCSHWCLQYKWCEWLEEDIAASPRREKLACDPLLVLLYFPNTFFDTYIAVGLWMKYNFIFWIKHSFSFASCPCEALASLLWTSISMTVGSSSDIPLLIHWCVLNRHLLFKYKL